MPGGNGTGPAGMGPMTGRGAGFCAGSANFSGGRGFFGWGRGMGCGRGFGQSGVGYGSPVAQNLTSEQELEGLKGQAEQLEGSLNQIKARIDELQTRKT